jgi:hypothetical protein
VNRRVAALIVVFNAPDVKGGLIARSRRRDPPTTSSTTVDDIRSAKEGSSPDEVEKNRVRRGAAGLPIQKVGTVAKHRVERPYAADGGGEAVRDSVVVDGPALGLRRLRTTKAGPRASRQISRRGYQTSARL